MAEPLLHGSHNGRPASGVKPAALYLCETHRLVYQTVDGGRTWATWGDLSAGALEDTLALGNTTGEHTIVMPSGTIDGTTGALGVTITSASAAANSGMNGRSISLVPGTGDGAGRDGGVILALPASDPDIVGAVWADNGVLVQSGSTAVSPAADPGNIADPPTVTPEDVGLKLNALLAAMRTAGSLA